jgi:CheY-like chemotaxis protein
MTLVLVIEDDTSVRAAVHTWLERRGMDVLAVGSGAAGIEHLEKFAIDLAVVAIFMPDMDGLEIIRRFSQRTPRVPVIAMSGFLPDDRYETAPDFLGMAGKLGAAFCLRKPFGANQLMAAIEACLDAPVQEAGHVAMVMSSGEWIGGEPRNAPVSVRATGEGIPEVCPP